MKKSTRLKRSGPRAFFLISAGLILLFTACAPLAPTRPEEPTPPAAETVLKNLAAEAASPRSFAGRGRVRFVTRDSHQNLDMVLAAAPPDRFRVQLYDFIGRPALTMVADQAGLFVLDHREKIFYRGLPTPAGVGRFLPVALSVEKLISLSMGFPPFLAHKKAETFADHDAKLWRIELFDDSGTSLERLWLTRADLQVVKIETGPRDDPTFQVLFSGFLQNGPAASRPKKISLNDPKNQSTGILEYDEIKIDPDLPPDFFRLAPPPGIKTRTMPADGDGRS
ncbi:MAG: DUF4292 domain-containing protein [Pseudomonadota bacterium]